MEIQADFDLSEENSELTKRAMDIMYDFQCRDKNAHDASISDEHHSESSDEDGKKKSRIDWLKNRECRCDVERVTYAETEELRMRMDTLRNKYAFDSNDNPLKHRLSKERNQGDFEKLDQRLKLKKYAYHRKRIEHKALDFMLDLRHKLSFFGIYDTYDEVQI